MTDRIRAIRVSDDLWAACRHRADREGESISSVVRTALVSYASGEHTHAYREQGAPGALVVFACVCGSEIEIVHQPVG